MALTVFLVLLAGTRPVSAQVVPGGGVARTVVGSDGSEGYVAKSLAVGVPSLVLTVANATVVPAGGVGFGILGLALGAAQVALAADGPRSTDADAVVVFNAAAGVAAVLAAVRQIRATHALGPPTIAGWDRAAARVPTLSLLTGRDGPGFLLSWRW